MDVEAALAEVADVRTRHAAAKVAVAFGGLLVIALLLAYRRWLVPARGRGLATVGTALAAIGLAANSLSQATHGYLLYWASAPDVARSAGADVVAAAEADTAPVTLPVSFWSVPLFAVGLVLVAVALWRAGSVPRWVPVGMVVARHRRRSDRHRPARCSSCSLWTSPSPGPRSRTLPGGPPTWHRDAVTSAIARPHLVPGRVRGRDDRGRRRCGRRHGRGGGDVVESHLVVDVVVGAVSAVTRGPARRATAAQPDGLAVRALSGVAYVGTAAVTAWVVAARAWQWPGLLAAAWASEWLYRARPGPAGHPAPAALPGRRPAVSAAGARSPGAHRADRGAGDRLGAGAADPGRPRRLACRIRSAARLSRSR